MTPFYSRSRPQRIQEFLKRVVKHPKRQYKDENAIQSRNLVNMNTNSNLQVIPDHEIRMALHYKASTIATGGTLFLFFNKKSDQKVNDDSLGINFDPFLIPGADTEEGIKEIFFNAYQHAVKRVEEDLSLIHISEPTRPY